MKIAFICQMAHTTIIEKPDEVEGVIPKMIACSFLNCGCDAGLFPFQIDQNVTATHVFYSVPDFGEIVSLEEQTYLDSGGLMFKTIPENVPEDVKKEFTATEGINKLAMYMISNFPVDQRLPDIIDTAILHLTKYKGHLSLMKMLKGRTPNGKDLN